MEVFQTSKYVSGGNRHANYFLLNVTPVRHLPKFIQNLHFNRT